MSSAEVAKLKAELDQNMIDLKFLSDQLLTSREEISKVSGDPVFLVPPARIFRLTAHLAATLLQAHKEADEERKTNGLNKVRAPSVLFSPLFANLRFSPCTDDRCLQTVAILLESQRLWEMEGGSG